MLVHPCWKMFTVGESRPIFVMQIMYNAVKRLRDGLASRHLSALSAIYVYSSNVMNWVEVRLLPSIPLRIFLRISLWILDKYSSTSFWRRVSTEFYGKKALNIIIPPPRFVVILFCLFFNHIFTYWLVSICLYCCPLIRLREALR